MENLNRTRKRRKKRITADQAVKKSFKMGFNPLLSAVSDLIRVPLRFAVCDYSAFQHYENTIIPADVFVGAYGIRPGGNGNSAGYCSKGASLAPLLSSLKPVIRRLLINMFGK